MRQLTKNFYREEFACKCGECDHSTVDAELLTVLQRLRDWFRKPITINSAHRCRKHNTAVGGSNNSKHLLGIAADIVVEDISPEEVYKHLDGRYLQMYGIGKYSSFVHIDVRQKKARWIGKY